MCGGEETLSPCKVNCFLYLSISIHMHFLSQLSEVQMHESGSEPTSHIIPASQTENGNNSENGSRVRSSQTPPPEAPQVSGFSFFLFLTSFFSSQRL